jgi:hypothetical protein
MLIRIFSPTECGLIRDANLKKCGLNRMTTVLVFMESSGCMGFQFLKQRFVLLFFFSQTLVGLKEEEKGIFLKISFLIFWEDIFSECGLLMKLRGETKT